MTYDREIARASKRAKPKQLPKPKATVMLDAVRMLLQGLGTPVSLAVLEKFENRDSRVFDMTIPHQEYRSATDFALDYLSLSILSKVRDVDFGIDRSAVALGKWKSLEEQCAQTNRRIAQNVASSDVDPVLLRAQRKIADILGKLDIVRVLDLCKMGPGATYDLLRNHASLENKITRLPISITHDARPYLTAIIEDDPHWSESILGFLPTGPYSLLPDVVFNCVRGNRFTTVPKNSKTDRCIAIEPTGNAYLQQGVGQYIRRRLKRFGVDLNDQQVNQNLAKIAFSSGFSTLDLSGASDTVSSSLVWDLLPYDWAVLLDTFRSPCSYTGGKWHHLSKFSSMGNAFTFELESLIFYAVSSAAQGSVSPELERLTFVYGDDIIVSNEAYDKVTQTLEYCGFTLNRSKTFTGSNPFRESCGSHFFLGSDVKPIYLKNVSNGRPLTDIIRFANSLVRWSIRQTGFWQNQNTRTAWNVLFHSVPSEQRPLIPLGDVSDDGFIVPRGMMKNLHWCPNHGYRCLVLRPKPQRTLKLGIGHLAYWLRRRNVSHNFGYDKLTNRSEPVYQFTLAWKHYHE